MAHDRALNVDRLLAKCRRQQDYWPPDAKRDWLLKLTDVPDLCTRSDWAEERVRFDVVTRDTT